MFLKIDEFHHQTSLFLTRQIINNFGIQPEPNHQNPRFSKKVCIIGLRFCAKRVRSPNTTKSSFFLPRGANQRDANTCKSPNRTR